MKQKDESFSLALIAYTNQGFDLVMHILVEQNNEALAEETKTIINGLSDEEAAIYKMHIVADVIKGILD